MPDETLAPHLPLSPRDFLILFALAERDRHGYGLIKDVERASEGTLHLDPANLYRTLKRLGERGLLEETDRRPAPAHDDGRRRRYYRITSLGRGVVGAEAARLERLAGAARARKLVPGSEPAG